MAKPKQHAEHNEKLSLQLFAEKSFLDWANTTAFYAALHFVKCKILPGEYNGIHCTTIVDAMSALKCNNKHEVTAKMVKVVLPAIDRDYRYLLEQSSSARYREYLVSKHNASLCQQKLAKIKGICCPE